MSEVSRKSAGVAQKSLQKLSANAAKSFARGSAKQYSESEMLALSIISASDIVDAALLWRRYAPTTYKSLIVAQVQADASR